MDSKNPGSIEKEPVTLKIDKILVPVDGSEDSRRAAKAALALAKSYRAELIVLMASTMPSMFPAYPTVVEQYFESEEHEAKDIVEEIVSISKKEGVNAKGEVKRAVKSVVEVIVQAATDENVDLIVIGTRGLGGFKKLLMGSVSSGVVAHAHCNVLVVK